MSRIPLLLIFVGSFIFPESAVLAQKTIESVIVAEFEAPYDVITILIDEEQFDYNVTEETEFLDSKKKKINAELFSKGCEIDLTYSIENRKRVAKKVKLISNENAGSENFTGVYELLEENVAYIDGRKVQLSRDATLDCSGKKKCGCSKGMSYLDFSEISEGDFLTVKGVIGDGGVIYANEVTVCRNKYTDTDRKLRTAVENSYNAKGTHVVSPPTGIVVPPNTLHQGNIKIGNLEYKLLDDVRIQGYVNMVGNRVLPDYAKDDAFQKEHDIFFRFYVIDNPIPNAFAFPNGMVFIHTGLLQLMENEAQLAAVLGHEIAHVTYEHSSSRFQSQSLFDNSTAKRTGKKLLGGVMDKVKDATGMTGGGLGESILDGVGVGIAQTKPSDISNLFEKSKETQADRVGLMYMYLAGYDVREAANFWQIMSTQTGNETFQSKLATDAKGLLNSNAVNLEQNFLSSLTQEATSMVIGNFLETIYTSHPLTKKRLKDINQLLLTTYEGEDFGNYMVGLEEYEKFLSSVK
mgnify:CR=1 FL=1